MKISIVGTGYVGLVSGTCFAEIGHQVDCIDIDKKKIALLKDGISPIYEPGLEELLKKNIQAGRLSFSTGFDSIASSSAVFLAVGTPSQEDGSADLKYLYSAVDQIIERMADGLVVVIKSTVPVGTAAKVHEYIRSRTTKPFHLVNNPEFLKEGAAINDFMRPDRIVIGTSDTEAAEVMKELYAPFVRQGHPIYTMSNLSAEMTKYAANCFLATKISFINEIAKLCDATGANIDEVRQGITSDQRIGKHFLYPSPGYGGSCFPKDVKALIKTAQEYDSPLRLIECTEEVNQEQREYVFQKINRHFQGQLKGKRIALWGVAFKANTDDIRETSAIRITQRLLEAGAQVRFFDPEASDNFWNHMQSLGLQEPDQLQRCEEMYSCAEGADALVLLTEWREFQSPDFNQLKDKMQTPLLFDMRNLYPYQKLESSGWTYFGLGRQ